MGAHYLIVVDMQKDFVDGPLGSSEARAMLPALVQKVRSFPGQVLFTKDTHYSDYLQTQEGRLLPVVHCVKGTPGWELVEELENFRREHNSPVYEKPAFGCRQLAAELAKLDTREPIASIELVGVCTDICVVSNALLLKAFLPEVLIQVDGACCAGVTPQRHEAALETLRSCQVQVI